MRAMVLDRSANINDSPLVMREVDDPHPGGGEVRVRVSVCAVCRTDLHIIEGDLPERKRPIIPGHQVVGVVDELGDGCSALKRAGVPDRGKLLLVGFGSSAHVVLQIALYRGYDTFVVTRSENHVQMARAMGAAWVGTDTADLPDKVDSAILFAPAGRLVPPIMAALERGGILSIAGIHLTDIPSLNYEQHLFYDKEIRSVAANTREDGRELLAEAAEAGVRPHVKTYSLADANAALQDMKHSRVNGTGVLLI